MKQKKVIIKNEESSVCHSFYAYFSRKGWFKPLNSERQERGVSIYTDLTLVWFF